MLTRLAVGLESLSSPDAAGIVSPKPRRVSNNTHTLGGRMGPPLLRALCRSIQLAKNFRNVY
jgi:hypothetical protein